MKRYRVGERVWVACCGGAHECIVVPDNQPPNATGYYVQPAHGMPWENAMYCASVWPTEEDALRETALAALYDRRLRTNASRS